MTRQTEQPGPEVERDTEKAQNGSAPDRYDSIRDQLRARRAELREQKTLDLKVPGYDGALAVRYKLLKDDETKKLGKRVLEASRQQDEEKAKSVTADFLIKACQCILVRNADDALEPLVGDDDQQVCFDQRLAEFLGFEADGAREVVYGTFSPDGTHPTATIVHFDGLNRWYSGQEEEINQALLGE
jgi:hypothetical protein